MKKGGEDGKERKGLLLLELANFVVFFVITDPITLLGKWRWASVWGAIFELLLRQRVNKWGMCLRPAGIGYIG